MPTLAEFAEFAANEGIKDNASKHTPKTTLANNFLTFLFISGFSYFTVTLTTAFFPLAVLTVILHLPFLTAFTTPFFVTLATFLLEDLKVTFSVALAGFNFTLSLTFLPFFNTIRFLLTTTFFAFTVFLSGFSAGFVSSFLPSVVLSAGLGASFFKSPYSAPHTSQTALFVIVASPPLCASFSVVASQPSF